MQACFLRDVRVIKCNSFGDSHFQTYVMDNVDIMFNFYLHITSYVSHTHTSCTHHTQIFAKLCTQNLIDIYHEALGTTMVTPSSYNFHNS